MIALPTLREVDLFDEAGYLRLYPGIKDAVAAGTVASAWDHFHHHGRREGRRLNDLDPDFYRRTYPQVEDAFGPLTPAECAVHYAAYGRIRGYRPNKNAPRSESAAGRGLWTDAPDALDRIDGQEDSGRITDRQAAMLRAWRYDGVLALDRPAGRDRVEPAALDLERVFAGACPDLPFACPALATGADPLQPQPWQPEIAPHPAAALDIHAVSAPIRALILGDPLAEALRLLFENRSLMAASRGFIRPLPAPPRRASALFGCTIPTCFVSVWIALEDEVELTVWKRSHRLPPVAMAERFPNLPEALRLGLETPAAALAAYDNRLGTMLRESGLRAMTLRLKRGEAVFLHPDLIHSPDAPPGTASPLATGRCLVAELCPRVLLPVFAEIQPLPLHAHGRDRFMSRFCADIEPLA